VENEKLPDEKQKELEKKREPKSEKEITGEIEAEFTIGEILQ
jgi:hypothetical protein